MADDTTTEVRRDAAKSRYEVYLDGELAGVAEYVTRGIRIIFTHTEIDEAFGGHGLGSILVREALDDAVSRGATIVPVCPFVAAYVKKHHDWDASIEWPARRD